MYLTYSLLYHQGIGPPPICLYPEYPLEGTLVLATILIWVTGSNTGLASASPLLSSHRVKLHRE